MAGARSRILDAAARVYSQHGFLGATTRLIAQEAGVSEVTLFRLFRSKDALVQEAIREYARREEPARLPEAPADPERELTEWCRAEVTRMRGSRELLRKCFAEASEHPELVANAAGGMEEDACELHRYVERLAASALIEGDLRLQNPAVTMLVSALVADALGREELPSIYSASREDSPALYVQVFLKALGRTNTGC